MFVTNCVICIHSLIGCPCRIFFSGSFAMQELFFFSICDLHECFCFCFWTTPLHFSNGASLTNKWLEGGAVKRHFASTKEGRYTLIKTSSRFPLVLKVMSSVNHPETPKKVYKASESVNLSCCRLCKSVGDISRWRNLYSKANRKFLVQRRICTATHFHKVIYCHIYFVGHACERRLIVVFLRPRLPNVRHRLKEESPTALHALKARKETNMAVYVPESRSHRGLNFTSTPSHATQVSPGPLC